MRTQSQPNAWYGDCLPDGKWFAVVLSSHIESTWGRIEFLPGDRPDAHEPLFARFNNDGTAFAGQSHNDRDFPVEYYTESKNWALLPVVSKGINPVIYDSLNNLRVSMAGSNIGSQGWRYLSIGGVYPPLLLVTGDQTTGPTASVPGLWEWTDLTGPGPTLIIGQGPSDGPGGGVLVWDGTTHRVLAPKSEFCRNIKAHRWDDGRCSVSYYIEHGPNDYTWIGWFGTVAELLALPPVVTEPPAKPVGPTSDPLPNNTVVDLSPYFSYQPSVWPRGVKTDTHGLNMHLVPEMSQNGDTCLWFQKFGEMGPQSGAHGELLSIDAKYDGYIRLRADCSNRSIIDTWTDDRWLYKRMKIGRASALLVDDCVLVKKNRYQSCAVTERRDFSKEMWIERAWPAYWCGPDLGERAVVAYVYNNTGVRPGQSTNNPGLYVEIYWMALGAGWIGWDSFPAKDVFKGGVFTLPSPVPKTQFLRIGGPNYPADVPVSCIPPATPEIPVPPIPPLPPSSTDKLLPGQRILPDAPLSSADKRFRLLYQSDGNLVLYGPSGALWATATQGTVPGSCDMQGDGNFVVYDKTGKPRWASGTNGKPGAWLLVQNDGNVVIYGATGAVWATNTVYVPPPIPPLPPVGDAPNLTIQGRQMQNRGALWIPRMVSGLTLLVRTPAQQAAFLDWAVTTGFNGVRVFAGALTWAGQTPEGAVRALPALLDAATARGLAVEVTAVTDSATGYNVEAHIRRVVEVVRGRKNVILELANEVGHPSQSSDVTASSLRYWGAAMADPAGVLWAVGAAGVDEPINDVYPAAGGDYNTAHLDRGRPRWNNVRRVREIFAIIEAHGAPALNNEPMGADEFDGSQTGRQRWNDPALFFTLGALERAFGTGGVHHSQAGLYAELPGPVQQSCAESYVRAHAFISRVLPGIVGTYKNVGHAASPLVGATFAEGTLDDGVVRAYSFIAGPTGVTVIVGGKGNLGLQWGNGWRPTEDVLTLTGQDGRYAEIRRITQ